MRTECSGAEKTPQGVVIVHMSSGLATLPFLLFVCFPFVRGEVEKIVTDAVVVVRHQRFPCRSLLRAMSVAFIESRHGPVRS